MLHHGLGNLGMPVGFLTYPANTFSNQIPGYTPSPNTCNMTSAITENLMEMQYPHQPQFGNHNKHFQRNSQMKGDNSYQFMQNLLPTTYYQASNGIRHQNNHHQTFPSQSIYNNHTSGNTASYAHSSQRAASLKGLEVANRLKRSSMGREQSQMPYKMKCLDQNLDRDQSQMPNKMKCLDQNVDHEQSQRPRKMKCVDQNVDREQSQVPYKMKCLDQNVDREQCQMPYKMKCLDQNVDREQSQMPHKRKCLDQRKMLCSAQHKGYQANLDIQGSQGVSNQCPGQKQKNVGLSTRGDGLTILKGRGDESGVCIGPKENNKFTLTEAQCIVGQVIALARKYMPHIEPALRKIASVNFLCLPNATCLKLSELVQDKPEKKLLELYYKNKSHICHIVNNDRCVFDLLENRKNTSGQVSMATSSVNQQYCIPNAKGLQLPHIANEVSKCRSFPLSPNLRNTSSELPYSAVSCPSNSSFLTTKTRCSPTVCESSAPNKHRTFLPDSEFKHHQFGRFNNSLPCVESLNYIRIVEQTTPTPHSKFHQIIESYDKKQITLGKDNSNQTDGWTRRPTDTNFRQHAAPLMKLPETVPLQQIVKAFPTTGKQKKKSDMISERKDDSLKRGIKTIRPQNATSKPKPVENSCVGVLPTDQYTTVPGSKSTRIDNPMIKTTKSPKESRLDKQDKTAFVSRPIGCIQPDVILGCFEDKNAKEVPMKASQEANTNPDMSCFCVKPQRHNPEKDMHHPQDSFSEHIMSGMALPVKVKSIPDSLESESGIKPLSDLSLATGNSRKFHNSDVESSKSSPQCDTIVPSDEAPAHTGEDNLVKSCFTVEGETHVAFTLDDDDLEMPAEQFGIEMLDMIVNASQ